RKPDVEGKLRGLSHRPKEEANRGEGEERSSPAATGDARKDVLEIEGTNHREHDQDGNEKAKVTQPRRHEGLDHGLLRGLLLEGKADQEVGTHPHELPENEEENEIARDAKAQHGEGKEAKVGEEAVVARFPVHVAHGVKMDEKADQGDDEEH